MGPRSRSPASTLKGTGTRRRVPATEAVSTASPYKFAHEVLLGIFGIEENAISAPDVLEGLTKNAMPEPISSIRKKEIIHKEIIEKKDMWKSTLDFVRATK